MVEAKGIVGPWRRRRLWRRRSSAREIFDKVVMVSFVMHQAKGIVGPWRRRAKAEQAFAGADAPEDEKFHVVMPEVLENVESGI